MLLWGYFESVVNSKTCEDRCLTKMLCERFKSFTGECECLHLDPEEEGTTIFGKIIFDKSTRLNIPVDSNA
jgi:hypothetical protein